MAASLPPGSVSTLVYANRFVSVALNLMAGSIATAVIEAMAVQPGNFANIASVATGNVDTNLANNQSQVDFHVDFPFCMDASLYNVDFIIQSDGR